MRKSILFFFLFLLFGIAHAQNVKTLDGMSLGKRSDFIKSCAGAAESKLMNVNGLEIDAKKYCSCVCDILIPTIHSNDILAAMKENKMKELFLEEQNMAVIMKCLEGNFKIKDEFTFEGIENVSGAKEAAMKNCIKEFNSDEKSAEVFTKEQAEKYCDCAITKLFSSGYTYKDLNQAEDENSEVYKKIVMPCVEEVLIDETETEEQGSKKK
jgi:hypothetical protein